MFLSNKRIRNKLLLLGSILCLLLAVSIQNPLEEPPIQEEISAISYDRATNPNAAVIENMTTNIIEVDNTDIFEGLIQSDDQNNLHFVWTKGQGLSSSIFYRLFNYSAQKWSTAINISINKPDVASDYDPDVIAYQNKVYITWTRNGNQETDTPKNIMFAIVQGSQILQDAIQITNQITNKETSPTIHISPNGEILIIDIRITGTISLICGYRARVGQVSFHSSYWVPYLIVTTINTQYGMISEYAAYWEHLENDTLHLLFRANVQTTTNRIYYGKNETNLGSTLTDALTESQIIQITPETPTGDVPTNLLLEGNPRNRMLYFGWEQGTSGSRNITIYNKTMGIMAFNTSACLNTNGADEHNPNLTFDAINNPVLVYHIGISSCEIAYYRGFSTAPISLINGGFGGFGFYPTITATATGDIFVAYRKDSSPIRFNFVQFDLTSPNLQITNPSNNSIITGNVMLSVAVEPDTIKVNYSYYIDANFNGIEDDSQTWNLIQEITTSVNYATGELQEIKNFAYEWNYGKDLNGILIRVEAVDKNGLNSTSQVSKIKIDNHKPERVDFVSVIDQYGNNGQITEFGRGNITFTFDVYDNCSGIQKVELRNGTEANSQVLLDNSTRNNPQSNQVIWETINFSDGNYTHLYLRAYDGAGFYNTTKVNYSIFVDNTKPTLTFTAPVADGEYSRTFNFTMVAADDTQQIEMKFKNDTMGSYGVIGMATKLNATGWGIQWITTAPYLNGNYTVYANVTDLYGNYETYMLNLSIDNLAPTIQYELPYSNFKVGLILNITILVDADTVETKFGYKNESMTSYFWTTTADVAENASISNDGIHKRISMRIMLDKIPPSTSEINIGIIANCTDNQGYSSESPMNGKLVSEIPKQPNQLSRSEYYLNGTVNSVKVIFYLNGQLLNTLDKYLIYRSLAPLPVTLLNNGMNGLGRLRYLGESKGEKYCVGALSGQEVLDMKDPTFPIFYDQNVSANTYYYYVLGVNIYGTPGLLSEGKNITVPLTTTAKEINLKDLQLMPYIFAGVVVVMGFVAISMVKATKSVRKTREIKKSVQDIAKQYNIETRDQAKSLTDRLDDMESSLEGGKEVNKGKLRPKKPEKDIDLDDFLNMKVETKKEESILSTGAIRKCAGCGWALSSSAVKCPKCGRVIL